MNPIIGQLIWARDTWTGQIHQYVVMEFLPDTAGGIVKASGINIPGTTRQTVFFDAEQLFDSKVALLESEDAAHQAKLQGYKDAIFKKLPQEIALYATPSTLTTQLLANLLSFALTNPIGPCEEYIDTDARDVVTTILTTYLGWLSVDTILPQR